jgi:hypothetical protein
MEQYKGVGAPVEEPMDVHMEGGNAPEVCRDFLLSEIFDRNTWESIRTQKMQAQVDF